MHLVGVTGGKISVLILRFSTICNHETLCKINRDYFEDIIVMIIFFFFFSVLSVIFRVHSVLHFTCILLRVPNIYCKVSS